MDAIGGHALAGFQVERGPGLGHAAKGHLLDGLSGGGIHDGCNDTHDGALASDARTCPEVKTIS